MLRLKCTKFYSRRLHSSVHQSLRWSLTLIIVNQADQWRQNEFESRSTRQIFLILPFTFGSTSRPTIICLVRERVEFNAPRSALVMVSI